MTYNIIAYLIYTVLLSTVIIKVGWLCYTNGKVYVLQLLPNHPALTLYINKMLLVGYYLVNLGYAVFMISNWATIHTVSGLIATIATHTAQIILLLGVLHYLNILGIYLLFNKQSIRNT